MKEIAITILLFVFTCTTSAEPADKFRLMSLLRQTEFYILAGNYERATELCDQSMSMFKDLGSKNDISTISGLHQISHAYSEKGMFSEAVKTESLLVEIFPIALPDSIVDYALYLNDYTLYLLGNDDIAHAETTINKALSIIENKDDVILAVVYFRAAEIYNATTPHRIELSIKYQKKAVDLYAKAYGKTDQRYLEELEYLARYYEKAEDYKKACETYIEIVHTRSNNDNEALENYISVLDRIICCALKINDLELVKKSKEMAYSIKLLEQEHHEAKYTYPEFPSIQDSLDYLSISKTLMSFRTQLSQLKNNGDEGQWTKVHKELKQFLSTQRDSYGKAYCLSYETFRKDLLLDWLTAIDYGLEALRIYDKLGIKTKEYVVALVCVAQAYHGVGNSAKAYDYIMRAFELRDDLLSSDHQYYNGMFMDMALYSSAIGNYSDAIKYGSKAVEAKEIDLYTDNRYNGYFLALNNLATYYGAIGHNDLQLETLQQLLERAEEIAPSVLEFPENPYLYNLSSSYLTEGDYDHAIEIGLRVKAVREKYGMKSAIANIDHLLALAYLKKGDIEKALSYANQTLTLRTELGADVELANTYELFAALYKRIGDIEAAERMERNAAISMYDNLLNNFIDLTSDDRTSYWNMYSSLYNIWYPNYFLQAGIADATELYNKSALFAKGILLTTDTEMSKLILESGDENAFTKYQRYLYYKSLLSKASANMDSTMISIDSLRIKTEKIGRELVKECKVFGDYTKSIQTTWQDVQGALMPNDIAVEFLAFPLVDSNDSILQKSIYAALILRKNDAAPSFKVLLDESRLEEHALDNLCDEELYDIIWGSIDMYLEGINNVYFSPAGKLHNINIEALPEIVGKNNQINYFRVSSTRILAQPRDRIQAPKEDAYLYGGLQYEASIAELIADSKLYKKEEPSFRGHTDQLDIRGGWDYLPGSLTEIKAIESTIKQSEIRTHLFTDSLGTEASFKSLNGLTCKIIHIATHGFYYTESDSVKMKREHLDYMSNLLDKKSRSYKEDFSLTRSGLLMAGCNNVLRGYQLPIDIDDGILYAKEIAGLNLRSVDLTTISSCDSGLGDITEDGVIGLQRAFKKAGANTILMSLHQVDDEATKILMVEFYKNLMGGKSKLQSLKDAQRYLRQFEGGKYDEPKYWASFILLDGLN